MNPINPLLDSSVSTIFNSFLVNILLLGAFLSTMNFAYLNFGDVNIQEYTPQYTLAQYAYTVSTPSSLFP